MMIVLPHGDVGGAFFVGKGTVAALPPIPAVGAESAVASAVVVPPPVPGVESSFAAVFQQQMAIQATNTILGAASPSLHAAAGLPIPFPSTGGEAGTASSSLSSTLVACAVAVVVASAIAAGVITSKDSKAVPLATPQGLVLFYPPTGSPTPYVSSLDCIRTNTEKYELFTAMIGLTREFSPRESMLVANTLTNVYNQMSGLCYDTYY